RNSHKRHATHRDLLSANPVCCRSGLARYTPRAFISLVARHGIAWHEKTLGQLFCDASSRQIVDLLRAECEQGAVEWWQPCEVRSIARNGSSFHIETSRAPVEAA